MTRHVVGRVEEIPPGGRKIVRVAGREIGIFNLEGAFYALRNSCPHQAARVCLGKVVGTALPSEVYEFVYGNEGRILRCPWHEWEYHIATGEAVHDPAVRIKSYPVEIADGELAIVTDQLRLAGHSRPPAVNIAIHYRPAGGHEEAALIFARRLFARYDEAITALALVPDAADELAVYLDGRLVHSQSATGRPPKLADIAAAGATPRPASSGQSGGHTEAP